MKDIIDVKSPSEFYHDEYLLAKDGYNLVVVSKKVADHLQKQYPFFGIEVPGFGILIAIKVSK